MLFESSSGELKGSDTSAEGGTFCEKVTAAGIILNILKQVSIDLHVIPHCR